MQIAANSEGKYVSKGDELEAYQIKWSQYETPEKSIASVERTTIEPLKRTTSNLIKELATSKASALLSDQSKFKSKTKTKLLKSQKGPSTALLTSSLLPSTTTTTTLETPNRTVVARNQINSRPIQIQESIVRPGPVHQATVIIRKDIHSFNFSDLELPVERPTASAHYLRNNRLLHDLYLRSMTADTPKPPKPPTTELDDVFISVKTTKGYHESRLALIIKTWFQLAKEQVRSNITRSLVLSLLLSLDY